MQTTQTPVPAPSAASFASLLAALATPAPKADPEWNDEALAEDVASLSYERALRSHARYRTADPVEDAEVAAFDEAADLAEELPARRGRTVSPDAFARAHEAAEAEMAARAAQRTQAALDRNLKNASITIRMSKAEADQLHRRAAEAGLTVSAYLRSCTFEAEALRAQVKEVLAELRAAGNQHAPQQPERQSFWSLCFGWMRRLLPPARPSHRVAQA
jgi:predicted DNA binding CopG/RHH family protein